MSHTNERISKLTLIDIKTANILIKQYLSNKNIESIETLSGGKSTTNYKITLKENRQYLVLRIYPQNGSTFEKEFAVHNFVKDYIPIPDIYYINNKNDIIDKPFAITKFIEGVNLERYIEDNNKISASLAEEIGHKLALIHQKKYSREGALDKRLSLTNELPPMLEWYEFFLKGRAGKRLGDELKERVVDFLSYNKSLLMELNSHFALSHGDFRPANLMVKDNKLVGIMDWEYALSAPMYFDIGQFFRIEEYLSKAAEESFLRGYNYAANSQIPKYWRKLAKLMDLANLLSLLDKDIEAPMLFANMKGLIENTLTKY